jgi:DNA polymerase-3 subunit epsilon
MNKKRQLFLDTETTGLETRDGHRIIEIACVEMINRRLTHNSYHVYINPERDIDEGAQQVHGISTEFLADKPLFADIVEDFVRFVDGAELIIHNASFDVGFINHEFGLLKPAVGRIEKCCTITDTLAMARKRHPGQRNNLDALCKRYGIDNSGRNLHGALIDADLLASMYLAMTSGQNSLFGKQDEVHTKKTTAEQAANQTLEIKTPTNLKVIHASAEELAEHETQLVAIEKASGECLWRL